MLYLYFFIRNYNSTTLLITLIEVVEMALSTEQKNEIISLLKLELACLRNHLDHDAVETAVLLALNFNPTDLHGQVSQQFPVSQEMLNLNFCQ